MSVRKLNLTLGYTAQHPELAEWQRYAVAWFAHSQQNLRERTRAVRLFLLGFVRELSLPTDPKVFFAASTPVPPFLGSVASDAATGAMMSNHVHQFLQFVLEREFGTKDGTGALLIHAGYRNPVPWVVNARTRAVADKNLSWVTQQEPGMETWRSLAVKWWENIDSRHRVLKLLLAGYLEKRPQFFDPRSFLAEGAQHDGLEEALPDRISEYGIQCRNMVHNFLNFVLAETCSQERDRAKTLLPGYRNPVDRPRRAGPESVDRTLGTLARRQLPNAEEWCRLGAEWLATINAGKLKVTAIRRFIEHYVVAHDLPGDPRQFLREGCELPDFFSKVCDPEHRGVNINDVVHDFLEWVLAVVRADGTGQGFRNPVPRLKGLSRSSIEFTWMTRLHPKLNWWADEAAAWLSREGPNKWQQGAERRAIKHFMRHLSETDIDISPQAVFGPTSTLISTKDWLPRHCRVAATTNFFYHFLADVLRRHKEQEDWRNPVTLISTVDHSHVLSWVPRKASVLAGWRQLALEWLEQNAPRSKQNLPGTRQALTQFFRHFLLRDDVPKDVHQFFATELPSFYKTACTRTVNGVGYNNEIHRFLAFVMARVGIEGLNPVPLESVLGGRAPSPQRSPSQDRSLEAIARNHPEYEAWRVFACEYLAGATNAMMPRTGAMRAFLEDYLARQQLPADPAFLLSRDNVVPAFFTTTCEDTHAGRGRANHVWAFIEFVLDRGFSSPDVRGRPVRLPAFHNPFERLSYKGLPARDESVHNPLPYGYLDELRMLLSQGPTFKDWVHARSLAGKEDGLSPDWFEVREEQLDKADPDCVWRLRHRQAAAGGPVLEMWSPVRWVALLTKLVLPLRTFQVRFLDSGEADFWRYDDGVPGKEWSPNEHPHTRHLAKGTVRKPVQQGVFRRKASGSEVKTVLYINTNKTNDIGKGGPQKGFEMPWLAGGSLHQDIYYWLAKLRDWQSKYNPVTRRASWKELKSRHLGANGKTDAQLAGYPDATFLFRQPETITEERHLPVTGPAMRGAWYYLLQLLERKLAARRETLPSGAPIKLVEPRALRTREKLITLFPLHSLRVSLITALALEGQVPFSILQKLVGHSRLLMTLYYTKPGAGHIRDALTKASARLAEGAEGSVVRFLADTEYKTLLDTAIANCVPALKSCVDEHPANRNPAGWMLMHHGACLVGGNTSPVDAERHLGGCYNGGPLLVETGKANKVYGPVPGGSRNCIRCRWFVTEPHHLPALAAHFNNLAYHFDEARNACLAYETKLQEFKRRKAAAEAQGLPFAEAPGLRTAERTWETAMSRFSSLAEDLVACWRLVDRCQQALQSHRSGSALLAVGNEVDIHIAFEETESELLQLAGVCDGAEVYPDLDPGKAVFRRSQLLDAALSREGIPPMFVYLSEAEQLLAGNAFLRQVGQKLGDGNAQLGLRRAIALVDAGRHLGQVLGMDLHELLPSTPLQPIPISLATED